MSILRLVTLRLKGTLQPFERLCRSLLFYPITWVLSALCLIFLSGKFADPPSKTDAATLQVGGATQNTPAVEIPDDAGVVNVKSFGAKGDGVSDDTAAITNAIQRVPANAFIYFPNGTYLISAPLLYKNGNTWRAYLGLQGESQTATIIKLADNTITTIGQCGDSYGLDNRVPRCQSNAMIYTGSQNATTSDSNGNEGYNNYIFDMTIDVGRGNPGAEGIHWIGHNSSAIRNVTIKSDDGQGFMGLDMRTQYFGPALAKNVTIEGFQYGMGIDQSFSSVTMEHITLLKQTTAGFLLMQNIASIRDLVSDNTVPAVVMSGPAALVLLGGRLSEGAPGNSAITFQSPGQVYLRQITSSGYGAIVSSNGITVAGGTSLDEYSSSNSMVPTSNPARTPMLPIEEAPEYSDNDFDNWANVKSFGAVGDGKNDDTPAIQAAIDSGNSTVYLPFGTYRLGSEVIIRENVCMFRGFGSTLIGDGSGTYHAISIQNTNCASGVITLNLLNGGGGFAGPEIEGASNGTVVLKDFRLFGYTTTSGWPGGGKIFLEDVSFGPYYFTKQSVWAKQLNPETWMEHVINDGGTLWVLGLKTENARNASTILDTRNHGISELLGGYQSTQGVPTNVIAGNVNCGQDGRSNCPMFINSEATVTIFTVGDSVWWSPVLYATHNRRPPSLIDADRLPSGRPGPFYWFVTDCDKTAPLPLH